MQDYRESILLTIKSKLASENFNTEDLVKITNVVMSSLKDYTLMPMSTELVTSDYKTEEVLKLFTGTLLTEGKSKKTIKLYISILNRFYKEVGKPLLDVDVFDIRIWLASKQQTISLRTCENYRSYLSAFYQFCTREELIIKNPMNKILPIKYEDVVRLPLSDVEVDALRSACKTLRERAELELFLSSGIRASELCAMNCEDINFNTLDVIVREGKGNKQRTTYINEICRTHLQRYLSSRTDTDECLFRSRNHRRITKGSVEDDLKRLGKRAGIQNVHPHRCRRTFATNLSLKGMDTSSIQKLMGHSNINTTMGYITLNNQHVKNEYRRCV